LQFGAFVPHVGPLANREAIGAFARKAEALEFHSLWFNDHIITPRKLESAYPGGRYPVPPEMPFLEPVATMLYVAAVTERIALGSSVLVITQRQPVLLAKQLATLDVLSGGRLIFGAGAGWMREEFEALNTPFDHRGRRMDEFLEVMRLCWTEDDTTFHGRFYDLENVGFYPKPLQKPHPPIWVGGWAEGALRRVAKYGDAWHAGGPPQLLAPGYARVKELAKEYGRDPDSIALTVRGEGVNLADPAQAIDQLRAYREVGVSTIALAFIGDLPTTLERMESFMRDVAPKV
jgi:probable F420-dependent oxidoreductase